jgi:hypothetical protein
MCRNQGLARIPRPLDCRTRRHAPPGADRHERSWKIDVVPRPRAHTRAMCNPERIVHRRSDLAVARVLQLHRPDRDLSLVGRFSGKPWRNCPIGQVAYARSGSCTHTLVPRHHDCVPSTRGLVLMIPSSGDRGRAEIGRLPLEHDPSARRVDAKSAPSREAEGHKAPGSDSVDALGCR